MGSVEIDQLELVIFSHIITYGNAADAIVTERIREEIETMWNEPMASVAVDGSLYAVVFKITASFEPGITDLEIIQNTDPRNNYFRIEVFSGNNISFVDDVGSNSGYFKLDNLYKGSTTAAHEYGHTLGLDHPHHTDLRGMGIPGIMYPRGTFVDPPFQYDPSKPAGVPGGTMNPIHRKVVQKDIDNLKLQQLDFENGVAILGAFTNVWHEDHSILPPGF
ncbi:MAG: peptidase M10 [Chitinophagaceae bacterium]